MKSLLIVEDEKMIRQGIVAMVKRAPVSIDEVLECRNGEEALEVLRSRQVEVMFTDIRMPKMDGISLIRHLRELDHAPKTVVVSGYDDFGYAVEALRSGVVDYILKPIEREKVFEILQKLDEMVKKEQEDRREERRFGHRQLRYVILNRQIQEAEFVEMEEQFPEEQRYCCLICSCAHLVLEEDAQHIQLCDMEGQSVFFVPPESVEQAGALLEEYCTGISHVHCGIREVQAAYDEAMAARKTAFVKGKHLVWQEQCSVNETDASELPKNFPEQFVQQFGTDKIQSGLKQLENYYFQAKRGSIAPESVLQVTTTILEQLIETYKNVLELDMTGYMELRKPLAFNDAAAFLEAFRGWILRMKEKIAVEFNDYRNKEKINTAVAYIKENYDKELNMAIVSNYISMNYSLFSLSFKQYTGMNFVSYLKMIRINEAKRLLEETEEKIVDISQMVGYENEKHFMKTFKSVCGVSPSEYRKNMQIGKIS